MHVILLEDRHLKLINDYLETYASTQAYLLRDFHCVKQWLKSTTKNTIDKFIEFR